MTNNQCGQCEHYHGRRKCLAFPERIPDRYWIGEDLHDSATDDQYGEVIYQSEISLEDIIVPITKSRLQRVVDFLKKALKGGPGSGNWGHQGVPGPWGGSSPTGGGSEEFLEHPGELRHSFNPDTGEFDVERHSSHVQSLTTEEYDGYRDSLEDYIEIEDPGGMGFEEPADFVGEDGSFEPQMVDDFVEDQDMDWEEERDFKMEVAEQSAERRMELADESLYVAAQGVEAREMEWESGYEPVIEEELAKLTFSQNLMFGHREDSVSFHGDFIETFEGKMEEFHEKETAAEQLDFAEEIKTEAEEIMQRVDEEGDPTGALQIEAQSLEKLSDVMREHIEAEMPSDIDLVQEKRNVMLGREERGVNIEVEEIADDPMWESEGNAAVERSKGRMGNGEQFFENYVSEDCGWEADDVKVSLTSSDIRSNALSRKSIVTFGGVPPAETVVHEYAHVMHRNSTEKTEKVVNDIFEERTEGLELTEIYKNSEEYGYEGAFEEHYTGKVYGHTQEGRYGDEVLSMGMQKIYKDPQGFYEEDPEHYALTFGVMKGLF